VLVLATTNLLFAREYQYGEFKSTPSIKSTAAGCAAPSGFKFLNVNNVNVRINTGGDMWWDLPGGIGSMYYVPAGGSATSCFSSSLWIAGLDINNQLKCAALRYRQVGQDYWTGPLTIDKTASIDEETCAKWDKFFVVTRAEVDEFIAWWNSENKAEDFPNYTIPKSITDYPAHGDISKKQSYYMAPFKDVDGDGDYDPNNGDYPYYDRENKLCPLLYAGDPTYVPAPTMESEYYEDYFGGILVDQVLKGDQTFWWVINDKGNFHTETNGSAIGMEIRCQAFAFATNDEINNMTFYTYEIINRSTYELTQTYFCPWADMDLGYAWDDYVGCDVSRGLGYCYNGDAIDGGGEPEAYGDQPPAVGTDFFQGPYLDPDGYDNPSFKGDGLLGPTFSGSCDIVSLDSTVIYMTSQHYPDAQPYLVRAEAINGVNFGNGIVDDERYGMKAFVYHDNTGGVRGDPNIAPEYYNYMRGIWKDGTRMLYGGNAHITSGGAVGPECNFMFPDDTDPCNWGTGGLPPNGGYNQNGLFWNETQTGNTPYDRRYMQSAGPFTLKPGAVNYITVGIPWARAMVGGAYASVQSLRIVDDKCQALFDNCFKVIDGPDAPDITIRELDREFIVYISNSKNSNNYKEAYKELDPTIKALTPDSLIGTIHEYDPYYRFEGYQIFQLKDESVSLGESRYDPSKVRLVAQYDIKNGISQLVNFVYNQAIGANTPVVEVAGGDNGIVHSFRITDDAFATGDSRLVNHKQYYYTALAYSYNMYKEYDQTDPNALDGQKKPYLAGRKNIEIYTGIPHKILDGALLNADYGDGPQVTRIEGQGNGGMVLEFTQETIDDILSNPPADPVTNPFGSSTYPIAYRPTYQYGKGPVNIKVVDPLNVKAGTFKVIIDSLYKVPLTKITGDNILGDTASTTGAKWRLIDNSTGQVYEADTTININNEQLFLDLGITVSLSQIFYPGGYTIGSTLDQSAAIYHFFADRNGLIESSIVYADSSRQWLDGVEDNDIPGSAQNWIRAGTYQDQQDASNNDWSMPSNPWDPDGNFEKIIRGTWAPYSLCAYSGQNSSGPAYGTDGNSLTMGGGLKTLASVDIVFTPDKNKWTRAIVIEMCPETNLAQDQTPRFNVRPAPSLDKNGNAANANDTVPSTNPNDPDYIACTGMSWFPGYAINLETGERLNIMFGEDSWLASENGRDMLFNPTSSMFESPSGNALFGGKHYIYVMSHKVVKFEGANLSFNFPAYDAGKFLYSLMTFDTIAAIQKVYKTIAYASTMYVGLPLSVDDQDWLSNEAKIRIRIAKPYQRHYSSSQDSMPGVRENNDYPLYTFTTEGMAPSYNNAEKAKSDLDLIGVVPNPYYAYSTYERNPLTNQVKIINLPAKCTVTIYNVSGTLIRQFTKDDPSITSIDWDLKNHAGIPISGGVYIVHIDSDAGEKIVKWFGSLRVVDLQKF
jgi:hypothetical protein